MVCIYMFDRDPDAFTHSSVLTNYPKDSPVQRSPDASAAPGLRY